MFDSENAPIDDYNPNPGQGESYHPHAVYLRGSGLACDCGYNGDDGFMVSQVDEDMQGNRTDAWFCPKCGVELCRCGVDCPPDEFGQVC